jgi:predicted porin
MKQIKTAVGALTALMAGASFAQSNVTLYGVIDAALIRGTGSISSLTAMSNSGLTSSQFGVRGTEDLGNGLKASFALEAGLNNENGSGQATNVNNQVSGWTSGGGLAFNRQSWVSLGNDTLQIRAGRDYTPQFRVTDLYSPFGTVGAGTPQTVMTPVFLIPTYVRASNSIALLYNTTSGWWGPGLWGTVMHYLGENSSSAPNSKDGTGTGVLVGYTQGPFSVSASASRTTYLAGDNKQNNIGASYDAGVATVMAHFAHDSVGALNGRGFLVGGLVPAGSGVVRISYSQYKMDSAANPESRKLALGYVYNLSKRTALYGTYANVRNSGGAAAAINGAVTAPNDSSTGFDLGIRHSF